MEPLIAYVLSKSQAPLIRAVLSLETNPGEMGLVHSPESEIFLLLVLHSNRPELFQALPRLARWD